MRVFNTSRRPVTVKLTTGEDVTVPPRSVRDLGPHAGSASVAEKRRTKELVRRDAAPAEDTTETVSPPVEAVSVPQPILPAEVPTAPAESPVGGDAAPVEAPARRKRSAASAAPVSGDPAPTE